MITELELMGNGFAAGEKYMLRYHKSAAESQKFDFGIADLRAVIWTGFRYRDDQVSVLLRRQGGPSARA